MDARAKQAQEDLYATRRGNIPCQVKGELGTKLGNSDTSQNLALGQQIDVDNPMNSSGEFGIGENEQAHSEDSGLPWSDTAATGVSPYARGRCFPSAWSKRRG